MNREIADWRIWQVATPSKLNLARSCEAASLETGSIGNVSATAAIAKAILAFMGSILEVSGFNEIAD
jgi:hypothetical protein